MPREFDTWLGKQETLVDWAAETPVRRLAALLDHQNPPWVENELPPLGHWLFHLTDARQSELGSDGHPRKGGFMPPIPFPRRMWAGSRIRFLRSVPIGVKILRRSTIADITFKAGTSGDMALVTVQNQIICDGALMIEEDQDIAYVSDQTNSRKSGCTPDSPPEAEVIRRYQATPEVLFRFSALTFNAHRIHYDRDYARDQEHYPGLVVHGPLLAMLLVDHFLRQRPATRVARFSFRARAPVFDFEPFDLCFAPKPAGACLWVAGTDRQVKMTAELETTQ